METWPCWARTWEGKKRMITEPCPSVLNIFYERNCDKNSGTISRNYRAAWAVRLSALLSEFANTVKPWHCKAAQTPPNAHSMPHQSGLLRFCTEQSRQELSWHSGLSSPQLTKQLQQQARYNIWLTKFQQLSSDTCSKVHSLHFWAAVASSVFPKFYQH